MKSHLLAAAGVAALMMSAASAHASVITSSDGLTFNGFPTVESFNDQGPETFGPQGVTYTSSDPTAAYGYDGGYGFDGNGYSSGEVLSGTDGDGGGSTVEEVNFAFTQPVSAAGFKADWAAPDGPVSLNAYNSAGAIIETLALTDAGGNNLQTPDVFYGFSDPGIASIGITGEYVVAFDGIYSGAATLISAAPEPATWALLMLGIGGIGLMLRRAKNTMGLRFKDALSA